jgi:hypothetical protein
MKTKIQSSQKAEAFSAERQENQTGGIDASEDSP